MGSCRSFEEHLGKLTSRLYEIVRYEYMYMLALWKGAREVCFASSYMAHHTLSALRAHDAKINHV